MTGENDVYCNAEGCNDKNGSKNTGDCIICRRTYHYTCAGAKSRSVFTCPICVSAVTNIDRLSKIADDLEKSYSLKYDELKKELDKKAAQCSENEKEIAALKKEVADLKSQTGMSSGASKSTDEGGGTATAHLVLADSILRDVDITKLKDTTFVSQSGAKISNLRDKLNSHHGSSFDSITLHVATNDLESISEHPDKIPDVIEEYSKLIDDAKAMTSTVKVSSVCPRLDGCSELVAPFNAALGVLCQESEVNFVDHTPSFTLSDGVINDGYIWRNGPHLTRPGVNRLI